MQPRTHPEVTYDIIPTVLRSGPVLQLLRLFHWCRIMSNLKSIRINYAMNKHLRKTICLKEAEYGILEFFCNFGETCSSTY